MSTNDPAGRAPLLVTQPLLPDLGDFETLVKEIWASKYVTNHGPLSRQLEKSLALYLDVPTAMAFNNGTIALLAALKMLDLPPGSEVITSPVTFAATAHAVHWNGLRPVFADVMPGTLTICPDAVRKAVTPQTSAILAVHVYGSICETEALQEIADEHGLKVIYDAAHAFGAAVNGRSIAGMGDASMFSFHATKLFNTIEGGMITTPRAEDAERIYYLRNFGIKNEEEVVDIGINGKLNELQAAVGILNLPLVAAETEARAALRARYDGILEGLPGLTLQPVQKGVRRTEQYYPLIIDAARYGRSRDEIYDELKAAGIFARKYFHPVCTDFEPYRGFPIISTLGTPLVETVKSQVLCLPFHSSVDEDHLATIAGVFRRETLRRIAV